jgi:hypothetical protein
MMGFLKWPQRLDRWLIESVSEPLVWWLERRNIVSSWNVARFLIVVCVAGGLALAWQANNLLSWGLAGLYVLFAPLRVYTMRQVEAMSGQGANPEKYHGVAMFWRLWMVFAQVMPVLLSFVEVRHEANAVLPEYAVNILTVVNWSFLIHLYVSACDRPPPEPVHVPDAAPEAA